MNSKKKIISKIYDKRFLKSFTLAIIKVIETKSFHITGPKEIVDADLIPKLSNELMRKYALNEILREQLHDIDTEEPVKPVHTTHLIHPKHVPNRTLPRPAKPKIPDITIDPNDTRTGFQKIQPLLDDFSISRIQCIAPKKPLMIIRSGQREITKIALTKENIKDIFLTITDLAHIPLIEGPVKISLKSYKIEGINSNIMDSKFIIQKNTAYSLLEQQR